MLFSFHFSLGLCSGWLVGGKHFQRVLKQCFMGFHLVLTKDGHKAIRCLNRGQLANQHQLQDCDSYLDLQSI